VRRFSLLVVLAAAVALGVVAAAPAGVGIADDPCPTVNGENTNTCPTATTGTPYSIRFHEAEGSGCGPGLQTFNIDSGTFPPGLVLATSGQVSGIPTQAGSFTFYIRINEPTDRHDEGCQGSQGEKRFTIPVVPGLPKLTLGPESTTAATTGAPYSLQVTATVPDAKTFSISAGALPPGLALDPASGLISGTPTTAGTYDFTVYAKVNADSRSDNKALQIVVRDPLVVSAGEPFVARRAAGEVSVPFDATISATGGFGTYTWAVTAGTVPPGLKLVEGALTGTPTRAGSYAFIASVTDVEGRKANFTARIVVADKLSIATLVLKPAKLGKLYAVKLATLGGVKPASWRVRRGPLPRGIRFDRVLGTLSGTPTKTGRYRVTFEATDALGVVAKRTLTILVAA
jgi:large repetitive protein